MYRLALVLMVFGCGKSDPASPKQDKAPAPAVPAIKGLLVTATDVLLDGKSLGVSPERLLTDRSAVSGPMRAVIASRPAGKSDSAVSLTYTSDAPAPVVLAVLRGIDEAAPAPPAPSPKADEDHGTAMALDEGAMGKLDADAPSVWISVATVANGARDEICQVRVPPPPPAVDERVNLSITIDPADWKLSLTRLRETSVAETSAKLATALEGHKASAFFIDRTDIELAARPNTTGAQLTQTISATCGASFIEVVPLTVAELEAQFAQESGKLDEDAKPAVSTLDIGPPSVKGDLDPVVIRRYLKRGRAKLSACYEAELAKKSSLNGTVTATFEIGAEGTVTKSDATGLDPQVARCVASVIRGLEFPRPKAGVVQATYPLTFKPAPPSE